jgi:hypothetical protein
LGLNAGSGCKDGTVRRESTVSTVSNGSKKSGNIPRAPRASISCECAASMIGSAVLVSSRPLPPRQSWTKFFRNCWPQFTKRWNGSECWRQADSWQAELSGSDAIPPGSKGGTSGADLLLLSDSLCLVRLTQASVTCPTKG